jgi:hypothetical protein
VIGLSPIDSMDASSGYWVFSHDQRTRLRNTQLSGVMSSGSSDSSGNVLSGSAYFHRGERVLKSGARRTGVKP